MDSATNASNPIWVVSRRIVIKWAQRICSRETGRTGPKDTDTLTDGSGELGEILRQRKNKIQGQILKSISQKFSKEQLLVLKAWLMCKEQDLSNDRHNNWR
jgi:hypothetical protein